MNNFDPNFLAWGGFLLLVLALLALDLGVFHKGHKEVGTRSALLSIGLYVLLAGAFCAAIFCFSGTEAGTQFATGYIIELTLSIDNIFVIALIMKHFMVPKQYHHSVLFWGILVAIVLRFVFIVAATGLIKEFDWVLYIFGAFLVITGIKMAAAKDEEPKLEENLIVNLCKKNLRTTENYSGGKFFVRQNLAGKSLLYATPLFVVLMVVNLIDIVFAFDSIPAIFAITTNPFIVFTSNIFAILGLRSMYFVLVNVIERFKYLKYGLAVILVLIGTKMIINHYYMEEIISTSTSLLLTAIIISASILYSLYKTKKIEQKN